MRLCCCRLGVVLTLGVGGGGVVRRSFFFAYVCCGLCVHVRRVCCVVGGFFARARMRWVVVFSFVFMFLSLSLSLFGPLFSPGGDGVLLVAFVVVPRMCPLPFSSSFFSSLSLFLVLFSWSCLCWRALSFCCLVFFAWCWLSLSLLCCFILL